MCLHQHQHRSLQILRELSECTLQGSKQLRRKDCFYKSHTGLDLPSSSSNNCRVYNMRCQACSSENAYCIDSREVSTNARRRRYKCTDCGHRFSTIEVIIDGNSIDAVKDLPSLIESTKKLQDYIAIAQTVKNLGDLIRCIEKKEQVKK